MARRREETALMLRAALDAMAAARAATDPVAYSRADTLFHDAFIKNCRNRYLQEGHALAAEKPRGQRIHHVGAIDLHPRRVGDDEHPRS